MREYGLFNDESESYTAEQAVEAGFYSVQEAWDAVQDRYSIEDDLHIHLVEEEVLEEEDEDD